MDVPLERFGIVEPPDEKHFLTEIVQRRKDLSELHVLAFTLGPPFLAMKTIPREKHGEPNWSFASCFVAPGFVSPDIQRFKPWQRHADANTTKKSSPRKCVGSLR